MAKEISYNAAEAISAGAASDPYQRPAFSREDRLRRLVWHVGWLVLYRLSPRPIHAWRSMVLRAFGATIGPGCHFYPGAKIWAPWNLVCEDNVTAGDEAEIYNPAPMRIGSHAVISQGAYLCGATHDFNDPRFPLQAYAMTLGAYCWICARASVGPGVNVGVGAVLGLGSVATKDLEAWGVYAGCPAVKVKDRNDIRKASAP